MERGCWLGKLPEGFLSRLVGFLDVAGLRALGEAVGLEGPAGAGLLAGLAERFAWLERVEEAAATSAIWGAPRAGRWDEFRFEDLGELRDKCHDGLDVVEEHGGLPVPPGVRWELELGILAKVEEGYAWIRACTEPGTWADRDSEKLAAEDRRTRFTISSIDAALGSAHVAFLNAFLEANPDPVNNLHLEDLPE